MFNRHNPNLCTSDGESLSEQLRGKPFITKKLKDEFYLALEGLTEKPDVVINRITPALIEWCKEWQKGG